MIYLGMETNNATGLKVQISGWDIWPTMWAARPIYRRVGQLGSKVCHFYSDSHDFLASEGEGIICLDGKIYKVA